MSRQTIVTWVAFQAVWLACAIGAAQGTGALGIAASLAFAAAVIARSQQPAVVARLVAASGIVGLGVETALSIAGLIRFAAPWPAEALAPAWIVALWMAFGATLPSFVDQLGAHRLKVGAALGAVAGPLAYVAGARLGALELLGPLFPTLLTLAIVWAAVMAGLIAYHARAVR